MHSEWHHHPRHSHSHNNNSRTQTHGMRRKNSAPGTHSDGHHQQQEPRCVCRYSSRVSTQRAAPTQKHNRRNEKKHNRPSQHQIRASASRFAAVSTAHPQITPHSRRILRRQIHNGSATSAVTAVGRESLDTHPRQAKCHTTQLDACRQNNNRITSQGRTAGSRPPRKSRHSQNTVCALSAFTPLHSVCNLAIVEVCTFVCLSTSKIAKQLCSKTESKERNGRERQIAHTHITHIITDTRRQRNRCTQTKYK
ncbi:hypothetical protein TCDM_12679 [Trypanosoma cruzi Dm28c]|uniref:Uncharacterized protein n=1 Tax=Trypanosoma cruzi Dm28c TaxID=1416333 RepID=V5A4Z4_TRYCR|nr:hypothetical protein TCDM_12679 [Trypanosoma cruzi Dm28c]